MSDILDDVIKEELPTVSAEETTLPDEQTEQNLPEEKKTIHHKRRTRAIYK